ncbi:hypothetical protein Tco_1158576 [Tanacetum coccineum]
MSNVDILKGIDTGGSPRSQDTMRGAPAQTRSERVLEWPIEPPLSEGHTSGSGEGRMEHQFELTANVPITPHDLPLSGGSTPRSDKDSNFDVLDAEQITTTGPSHVSTARPEVNDQDELWMDQLDWKLLKWKLHENCEVYTLFMDGTPMEINMLVEQKYPLIKELLEKILNLKLEVEEESTMAFDLIKFIKSMLEE